MANGIVLNFALSRINVSVVEKSEMGVLTKFYVRVREFHNKLTKGQTMTEYALILAAVAVVVFVTYEVMGQDISALVNVLDSDLSAAAS